MPPMGVRWSTWSRSRYEPRSGPASRSPLCHQARGRHQLPAPASPRRTPRFRDRLRARRRGHGDRRVDIARPSLRRRLLRPVRGGTDGSCGRHLLVHLPAVVRHSAILAPPDRRGGSRGARGTEGGRRRLRPSLDQVRNETAGGWSTRTPSFPGVLPARRSPCSTTLIIPSSLRPASTGRPPSNKRSSPAARAFCSPPGCYSAWGLLIG